MVRITPEKLQEIMASGLPVIPSESIDLSAYYTDDVAEMCNVVQKTMPLLACLDSNKWTYTEEDGIMNKLNGTPGRFIIVFGFLGVIPKLNFRFDWLALQHQCGGYKCDKFPLVGTKLDFIDPKKKITSLVDEGFGRQGGNFYHGQVEESTRDWYRQWMDRLGCTSTVHAEILQEGVYPLDATEHNLKVLTGKALTLGDFATWSGVLSDSRPGIFILAENSD